MGVNICFTTDDIAAIYKELSNTTMSLEELKKKLRAMSSINKLASILEDFINLSYNKATDRLITYLKDKEPVLYETLKELKDGINIVDKVNDKLEYMEKLVKEVDKKYRDIAEQNVSMIYTDLVRETVSVVRGMVELSFKPLLLSNGDYFLNSDFILRKEDGTLLFLDELKYYYGNKFYTGSLKHNGKITLIYYKNRKGK